MGDRFRRAKLPSPERLTWMALKLLRQMHPEITWSQEGLLTIKGEQAGRQVVSLGLANFYYQARQAATDPTFDIEEALREYLEHVPVSEDARTLKQLSPAEARAHIVVMLKPASFVIEVARVVARMKSPESQCIIWPWVEDLYMVPVVDQPDSIAFMPPSLLEQWDMSEDELLEIGLENLGLRSTNVFVQGGTNPETGGKLLLIQTNDGYDASRILLSSVREFFARQLGQPYLVGVPNRDFLVAFQPSLRDILGPQVVKDYHTQRYAISPRLLRIEGERIVYDQEQAADGSQTNRL